MQNEYILGVNYWGKQWGTEMWRHYNGEEIRRELADVRKYGVKCLRVFPNWRDFQPVAKNYAWQGTHGEYANAETGEPVYGDGVDETRIEFFREFCRAAEENNLTLVVSIVTGWMSGMLFAPPVLHGKNLISDPEANMWMTRFIHRFVRELRDERAIALWDLGNECNCLGKAENAFEAYRWTRLVVDAIRAEDKSRPIASGMHGLSSDASGPWQIEHQGELCDILTTHPYPSPTVEGDNEPYNTLRMTFLPTAQSLYYGGVGKRPAYVQESGVFTQSLGNDGMAADFMRIQILSTLTNGLCGYQWWCAFDQKHLDFPPYSWAMVERELGLFYENGEPKPVALVMQSMSALLDRLPKPFPRRISDGVCLLSRGQAQQQIAISALTLAKQAGLDLDVVYTENGDLPDTDLFFMPAIKGWQVIYKKTWNALLSRVENGASLYISFDGGQISDFPEIVGATSNGFLAGKRQTVQLGERTLSYTAKQILLSPTTAEVLLKNGEGQPVLLKNRYGKGTVYFCDFSPETIAFYTPNGFIDLDCHEIYRLICKDRIEKKVLWSEDKNLGISLHPEKNGTYLASVLNYSDKALSLALRLAKGWKIREVLYGDPAHVPACDGCILRLGKE